MKWRRQVWMRVLWIWIIAALRGTDVTLWCRLFAVCISLSYLTILPEMKKRDDFKTPCSIFVFVKINTRYVLNCIIAVPFYMYLLLSVCSLGWRSHWWILIPNSFFQHHLHRRQPPCSHLHTPACFSTLVQIFVLFCLCSLNGDVTCNVAAV